MSVTPQRVPAFTPRERLDALIGHLYVGKSDCAPCVYRFDLLDSAAYCHKRAAGYSRAAAKAALGTPHTPRSRERVEDMLELSRRELADGDCYTAAAELAYQMHADLYFGPRS